MLQKDQIPVVTYLIAYFGKQANNNMNSSCYQNDSTGGSAKKIYLTILLSIMFLGTARSQITIHGSIADSLGQPIRFTSIVLKAANGHLIKSYLSDSNGVYHIALQKGGYYRIQFSSINYYPKQIEADFIRDTIVNIQLKENPHFLQAVEITSRKPMVERKIDRIVYHIQNMASLTGGDALNALKKLPGISVRNNTISLIGKSGIKVMLNGRATPLSGQDLLTFLRSLPSDEISRIEVITSPPAKYEAEGNSGLINIVLKKTRLDSWNAGVGATYIQSKYARNSIYGNFNYRKNRVSLSLNLNYRYGPREKEDSSFFYYPERYWGNDRRYKIYNNGLGTNVEFDYSINKAWTMGFQYLGNFYSRPVTSQNTSYIKAIPSYAVDTILKTPSAKSSKQRLNAISYFNKFKIDSLGKEIHVDLDYYNYGTDANSRFNTRYYLDNNSEIPSKYYAAINLGTERSINYSGTIDFELPYTWAYLKFGGKLSHTENNSSISLFNTTSGSQVLDTSQSNDFIYKEDIQAIYLSGDKKISEHFETKAGLRLENTRTEGVSTTSGLIHKNSYLKLFPTLYFLYDLNKDAFNLNFNRRIERPDYWMLNPFREYTSSISYIEGNPFLQPSYTTNYELNYTHNNNLNIRFYYSRTTNGYDQVVIVDPKSDVQVISPKNFIDIKNYGIELTYTYQNLDWWNSYIDLNLYSSKATSDLKITNKKASAKTIYFSTYNDFFFNKAKTIMGSINFWYNSPSIYSLTKYTSSSELDIAFKLLLLDKKLQIALVGSDLYYGNVSDQISYINDIKQIARIYFPTRHFKFTISYNFGNRHIKSSKRKFGNEEEQNRL